MYTYHKTHHVFFLIQPKIARNRKISHCWSVEMGFQVSQMDYRVPELGSQFPEWGTQVPEWGTRVPKWGTLFPGWVPC